MTIAIEAKDYRELILEFAMTETMLAETLQVEADKRLSGSHDAIDAAIAAEYRTAAAHHCKTAERLMRELNELERGHA